jgi:glutathione S-transferase
MYVLHYAPDNASLIVRLVLDEAAIPFRTVLVDRAARAQESPAFRALNPAGRIPVLETPHGPLAETGAILLWLADCHGLGPATDDPRRQLFLQWLFFTSNTAHAEMRRIFYPARYAPEGQERRHLERAAERMAENFRLLDTAAAQHPWLFAPPAPLGVYAAALCRWAQLYPAGQADWYRPADYPALSALCRVLDGRPATRRAALAEGLGDCPFSAPEPPRPPEGSAT